MAKRRSNRREEDIQEELVDVVQTNTDSTTAWFEKNKSLVMGLLAAAVILLAGFLIYKYFIKVPKEKEAKAAIYKAELQFERDSFALALENPGGGFEGLLDIIDSYSGTPTANLAKLYAGVSYLNLGRFDDAISYLQSHSAAGDYSPLLKNGSLGDAYSEKGDMDKALSFYEKAANAGEDALLTPYYLYKLGLLAKRNGNASKAKSAFSRIKNDYPNANEATNIDVLINSVSS